MEKTAINTDRLFVETQEIFKYLDKKIYDKIPEKIKKIINEYEGNYKFKYDISKELNEQDILQETKDLVVGIYYKYVADEESKKKIINNILEYEEIQLQREKELSEKYSVDNIFKGSDIEERSRNNLNDNESQLQIVKKDSLFKIIINKIFSFFKKG